MSDGAAPLVERFPWLSAGATLALLSSRQCGGCGDAGHDKRNCPALPKNPRRCAWCRTPGHVARSCPSRPADVEPETASMRARANLCRRCRLLGHKMSECPDRPAFVKHCGHCKAPGHQYETCPLYLAAHPGVRFARGTAPRHCKTCGEEGHYAKTCGQAKAPAKTIAVAAKPAPLLVDVTQYFGLVQKVATRFARKLPAHILLDDLISIGTIGLLDAAKRFDPTRGKPFETFAEWRIRGAIRDDLRGSDTLSRDMRRLSNEIKAATAAVESDLGRSATEVEIAAHMGIDVDELAARRQKLTGSTVVGIDDAGEGMLDRFADLGAVDPFNEVAHAEETAELVAAIQSLPVPMQQVLSLYYFKDLNLREVGEVMGVSESRICQIHTEAIRLLQAAGSDVGFKVGPPVLEGDRRRRRCGRCHSLGHNRRSCDNHQAQAA